MKQTLIILTLFIGLQLHAQSTIEKVTIDPYKSLSYGAFFKSLTLHSDDTHAEYITGFDFQWGYIYELKIRKTKLKNPPMDASDTEYSLIKEISKTKAPKDYQFQMRLENEVRLDGEIAQSLVEQEDGSYLYFDEIRIVVPDSLSALFQLLLEGDTSKTGIFGFNEDGSVHLISLK